MEGFKRDVVIKGVEMHELGDKRETSLFGTLEASANVRLAVAKLINFCGA